MSLLRSWIVCTRWIYKHGAPTTLRSLMIWRTLSQLHYSAAERVFFHASPKREPRVIDSWQCGFAS